MKTIKILLAMVLITFEVSAAVDYLPEAAVTVIVHGENNTPYTDCQLIATFEQSYGPDGTPKFEIIRGVPDTNGVSVLKGRTRGNIAWSVKAVGCYTTQSKPLDFFKQDSGRWLPWNSTNIIMVKRIMNPISMYARNVYVELPEMGRNIGFDFSTGDWTEPYGKGRNADIFFRAELTQRAPDDSNYKLVVSFPNRGDGLVPFMGSPGVEGSALKSAHEAPAEGYQSEWNQHTVRKPGESEKSNIDVNRNYYFRVRTVFDEKGRIKSANYGKIYGDFMQFTYYFNPEANSRNVEFNPLKNLFTGTAFETQVNRP